MSEVKDIVTRLESTVTHALYGIAGEIIAGVSGGADSVALLLALTAAGCRFCVVTCDFHLRGDESTGDRAFVVDLCRRLGVECIEADMDVPGHIRLHGGSVEMACRDLRYDLFRRLQKERGAARIAVAHNADDNIETLFLNLLRTTGIEGLKGMSPDTGEIIRPLLGVTRREIEEYLKLKGETYRTDSTNLEDTYSRNYIRNRVLPVIEERFPGFRRSVIGTQRNLRGEARVISTALPDREFLAWEKAAGCGDIRTAVQRFVTSLGATARQIEEMARAVALKLPGRRWQLRDAEIVSDSWGLHIVDPEMESERRFVWYELEDTPKTRTLIRSLRRPLACFVPDDPSRFTLRTVRPGDRISPLGMKGTSLLSDIMKDARLTPPQRATRQVLADADGRIIWADSLKRSRHCLLPDSCQCIYALTADADTADAIIAAGGKEHSSPAVVN